MKALKKIIAVMMSVMMLFGTVSIAFTSSAASKKKVTKIKLNKTSVTMYTTQTYTLKATVSPSNASNKKVKWKSSNSKIAKVDSKGKVTALKKGKVTITCTAQDGSKEKATCKITVNNKVNVKSVKLNKSSVTLVKGKTYSLKATVSPSNASIKDVTWSSSNTKVATVDSKGKIKAVGVGSANITVKTKDKGKTAVCKVKVTPVMVTGVTLSKTTALVYPGKSVTLKATVNPSNAANKSVKWTTSDSKIATVDSKGVVRGIKSGKVTITCTAQDGSKKKATCKVTVGVPVTKVRIRTTESSENAWYVGKTSKLTATVEPSNATEKGITWKSSNEDLVTVDSKGNVKVVAYSKKLFTSNTITITAKAKNGVKDEFEFKIIKKKVAVTGMNFTASDNNNIWLVGREYKLVANVLPEDASETKIVFKSLNTKIAKIDSNGTLKAVAPGTVTITATAADNSKATASFSINISEPSLTLNIAYKPDYYAVGERTTLRCTATPAAIASRYGLKYDVSDSSIAFVTQMVGYNYASVKFLKAGKVKIRVRTVDNDVISDWVEVEVRDIKADKDFFENVKSGDKIDINAYIYNGSKKFTDDLLYTTPFSDCLKISDDGKSVSVINDIPADGAYIEATSIDGRMRHTIYFIPGQYVIPTAQADRLNLMKTFSNDMNKSDLFTSSYGRHVSYHNAKVDNNKSKTDILINGVSLGFLLDKMKWVGISEEEIMADIAPDSFIKDMYSDDYVENKAAVDKDSCPDPITTDLNSVSKIDVNDSGSTYTIKMVLKNQSKTALSSVASSAYGKSMPVIDEAYLKKYISTFSEISNLSDGDDSLEVKEISYGTVNQTYTDGYVQYTVDKFTGKVIESIYHYKSKVDVSNAKLNMEAKMGINSMGFNIKATFSMDIDTLLTLGNIYY